MTVTYPITDRRELSPAEKARWFGRKTRRPEELPRPSAHQSLVYRVGGDYLLDNDRLKPVDEEIINATNVCVVDMRRNAPVVVKLEIPSGDAASFEVLVTFVCTVQDPIAVVRGGVNAYESLWGHLKAHNRLFELALNFTLADVNEVRRYVGAQVKAYLTIKPAVVPGMLVSFANIEVSNPQDLVEFNKKHRDRDFEYKLDSQEQNYLQRKEAGQAQHSQTMESVAQHHQHLLDRSAHDHTHLVDGGDVEHELDMQRRRSAHSRDEFELNYNMIDGDPRRALLAAFAGGRIDATKLAEQLRELDEQDRQALVSKAERDRAARLELMAAQRDDRRLDQDVEREQRERDREERRQQAQEERDERRRREELEREDRLLRDKNAREDRIRSEDIRREDEWRRTELEVDVLKQMAAQGQFHTTSVGADKLFAKVMRMPQAEVENAGTEAVVGRHPVAELESDEDTSLTDTSQGVREEDE